jgi:hypothetical protein
VNFRAAAELGMTLPRNRIIHLLSKATMSRFREQAFPHEYKGVGWHSDDLPFKRMALFGIRAVLQKGNFLG